MSDDERRVLTVSSPSREVEGFQGISLFLPRAVGAEGVMTELRPDLSSEELLALRKSADILRETAVCLRMM